MNGRHTPRVTIRRRARWLAVAAAGTIVASCSIPEEDQARPIDPASLDSSSTNKKSCAERGVGQRDASLARVYLVRQQGAERLLEPVDRVIDGPAATPLAALSALIGCRLTDEERRKGYASALPEDLELRGLDPIAEEPGTFLVRLGPLGRGGAQDVDDLDKVAVAQIFFTLTDPSVGDAVRQIRISIDGRPVAVQTDQRTVSRNASVRRGDFTTSSPATTTTPTTTNTTTTAVPATTASARPTTSRAAGG